jgi:hypothetical protein
MAGSSVGPMGPYHIILRDKPSPVTSVGLVLDTDEDGLPQVREGQAQPVIPPQPTEAVDWTVQDPLVDFTYAMDDWSGGGLRSIWHKDYNNFYANADGLDARWRNVLTLGMKLSGPEDFLIRNGGGEKGATTGWTTSGDGTLSAVTTGTPRTGAYQLKVTGTAAGFKLNQTLNNIEVYRGIQFTVYAFAKRGASGAATLRINIIDTGTTSGGAVALSTSFQQITLIDTIATGIETENSITIEIECTSASSTPDVFIDDIFIVPTGGVVSAGMCVAPYDPIHNGSAEINSVNDWALTGGGANLVNQGSGELDGSRAFQLVNNSDEAAVTTYETMSTANRARLAGKRISLSTFAKSGDSVGDRNTYSIFIEDNDGTTSSTVVDSATYNQIFAQREPASDISSIKFGLKVNTFPDDGTTGVYFDRMRVRVFDGSVMETDLYAAFGRVIAKWDETNDLWDAVYIHASQTITSIVEFNGAVYAAFGRDNAYVVGTNTGFYARSSGNDDDYAHFFVVSRDTLWKSRSDGTSLFHAYIDAATDGEDGSPDWATEAQIGNLSRSITGLYTVNDLPVLGTVEGLHILDRSEGTFSSEVVHWKNISTQFINSPSEENFQRGAEFKGWHYFSARNQGLFRYNGVSALEDLTSTLFDPRQSDFGGRVKALASGSAQLFLLMDTPTTDATASKETWLFSLREEETRLLLHPLEKVTIGDGNILSVTGDFLWALGRTYDDTAGVYKVGVYRWNLPTKVIAPAFDPSPLINTTGTIELSRWHGGFPNMQKALISCLIHGNNLDAEHKVTVKLGVDTEVSTNTTWGTITADNGTLGVANFTTPTTEAVGYDFGFQITLETDDTVSPEIHAIVFKFVLSPPIKKNWELSAWVGVPLRTGQMREGEALSKTALLASLLTLRTQVYPIQLVEDFDQDDAETATYVKIRDWERAPRELEDRTRGSRPTSAELYRFILQEI